MYSTSQKDKFDGLKNEISRVITATPRSRLLWGVDFRSKTDVIHALTTQMWICHFTELKSFFTKFRTYYAQLLHAMSFHDNISFLF